MDEEAIGSCTRNMKEERDRRGHSPSYSISSHHDEDAHGQIDTAVGGCSMAEARPASTGGMFDPSRRRDRRVGGLKKSTILLTLLGVTPAAMAQSCISLAGSTTCPAFSSASISTDSALAGLL